MNETIELRAGVDLRAAGAKKPAAAPALRIEAYGGGVMKVAPWGRVVIDLGGLQLPAGPVPVLQHHDSKLIIGHGLASTDGRTLVVTGTVSGASRASREVVESARNGFPHEASVGCEVLAARDVKVGETVRVNGRTLEGPFRLITKSVLREVSVLPLGADDSTSVSIAARRAAERIQTMAMENVDNPGVTQGSELERARARGVEEAFNIDCGPAAVQLKATALSEGWTVAQANARALAMLRESRPQVGHMGLGALRAVSGDVDPSDLLTAGVLRAAGGADLAERAYKNSPRVLEAADKLGHLSGVELCQQILEIGGVELPRNTAALVATAMMQASITPVSLPEILGDVASKFQMRGYDNYPSPLRSLAKRVSLPDFKVGKLLRLGSELLLEQLGAGGEVAHGELSEQAVDIVVHTFARMLGLSRENIVNDDLGAFGDLNSGFGAGAARAIENALATVLMANAVQSDGFAFFSSEHNNLHVHTLDATGLDDACEMMLKMTDVHGQPIDAQPRTLVVPPELRASAIRLIKSDVLDAGQTNVQKNLLALVVEPRLSNENFTGHSATAWYVFSGPEAAALCLAFLNGQEQPTIERFGLDHDVNRLGYSFRAYHDFGVALFDPKGAVMSTGLGA